MKLRMAARRSNAKIASYDDDPLSGMANMFDLGMVFSVALLVAMVSAYSLPELLSGKQDMTLIKNPGTAEMEIIKKQGMTIKRLRISEKEIGGEGERLGTAYRLKSGEVVYIPETAKPPTSKP